MFSISYKEMYGELLGGSREYSELGHYPERGRSPYDPFNSR